VEVTRKVKPVVVTMGTAAASGGYYISCSADRVIAQPATITGSIGIFGGKVVAQSLLADHSVHLETVARGRRAGMFDLSRRFSDDQRSALERMVQDGYRLFIDRVALGRKKGLEEVERLARGRVWTGSQALERGLVDELGGMEEAVAAVRRLARIPEAEPVELAPFPSRWSLLDLLGKKRSRRSLWAAELEAAAAELQAVEPFSSFQACGRFLDGRSPLVLAPLRLDIR
jgi:protease-4